MAEDMQQMPFVKQLAANDRPTRDKAVTGLRTFLSGRRQFTELDLLKLWKGLFFCMWMSDRPRTQQRLAADLADLVAVVFADNVLPFLEAFWRTMTREWSNIDVLRMDKFLLLTRLYVGATFEFLKSREWQSDLVTQHLDLLSAVALSPKDMKVPDGLRYHVLDVYVDELDKADSPRSGDLPLDMFKEPLELLIRESPTKTVRDRAKGAKNDVRWETWEDVEEEKDDADVTED